VRHDRNAQRPQALEQELHAFSQRVDEALAGAGAFAVRLVAVREENFSDEAVVMSADVGQ
jgi:hypothetical protein